ncbi:MAG: hypothetical protein GXP31_07490, partial [Kiritimatiellaeota bacterium]|nr:hypothetical protein [Kiritimatiellota bacterium]
MQTTLLTAGLCISALAGRAPGPSPAWKPLAKLRKPAGNLLFTIPWTPAVGLTLQVVEKAAPSREVVIAVSNGGVTAVRRRPGDGEDARPIQPIIVHAESIPANAKPAVRVLVKFRENDWQVYLDDRLACKMPSPFRPPGRASLLANLETASVRFQPVQDEFFHSDFMIEKGAPNPLYPWKPQSGEWEIHTAQEDALASPESDLNRVKKVPLTANKSPNFYSLKGKGKAALITTGYPFYDEYEYAASVQINDGEAGLVFYHRDKDNYYALTLRIHPRPAEGGTLVLWRMKGGKKTVLARIATPLYIGQWYQPRVKVGTDRIECYLDNIRVAGVSETLPPGGRIGLYADTAKEARFDDVKLDAVGELHLRNVEHIRFYTLLHKGGFFRDRSFWHAATPPDQLDLRPPRSRRDQELIFGRPTHGGVVFRAEFAPTQAPFTVGLVSGFTHESRPYYRFRYSRTALAEGFALERVLLHKPIRTLYAWDQPLPAGKDPDQPVTLMADASTPGELRLYRNGQLVLIQDVAETAKKLPGAAGLFVGRNSAVVVRDLDYRFKRLHDYKEKIEKNEIFKTDPFMRNWSSPEGQWIAGAGGHMWHKSDFFGRFDIRLPSVKGAELEVGIPDDAETGMIAVKVGNGKITLAVGRDPKAPQFTKTVPIQPPAGKPQETVPFRLYYESYWTWLKLGDKVVARTRLPKPLHGTRVWVSGFKTEHLAQSRVNRYMVKDDLFSEAPHDWLAQGGTWQIINRFQCTPSWSHMIGESGDGLAAFWHKYLYGGDFTLEFYAGIRHGWYQRPGDLNCTVMAAETVPGSGYTVTATEYDPNLSENWSSFYRNGKRLLRSEKYLVPRRRKGYERKYLNPLLAKGRPIHGAWYYIKLRRIGRKLEYYFDNQLVFTWVDKEPIPEGLVGIWTFKQAMTVARIKISARTIRPRPFAFRLLPAT